MSLINYDINLDLTWSRDCVISSANGEEKFAVTDTKLYILAVTLSIQYSAKLFKQLRSGFKGAIFGININQKF